MSLTVDESVSEQGADEQIPTVVIRPQRAIRILDFGELWRYRELLYFLVWRDLKVRYKQTAIGVMWAVLQPLAMMSVFALFFGQLARVPSDGLPYPVFALAALVPWQFFARVLAGASESLIRDQNLITKVYFPRVLVPLSTTLSALVDYAVSMGLLIMLMVAYGIIPGIEALAWPGFALMLVFTAFGIGLWLSALNVEFRDVQHTIPFLVQLWFFMTPVVYPSSLVPDAFRQFYALNPMVGLVEGMRWVLLGANAPSPSVLATSFSVSSLLFVSGLVYFRRRERFFADSV